MCIKNRALSLIYKLLLAGLCGFGLYSYSGLPAGRFDAGAFKYFTILSNLLALVFLVLSIVYVIRRIAKDGARGYATYAPGVKGAVLMAVLTTMLVYWIVLAPHAFAMEGGGDSLQNYIVHLYVPIGVALDWLLFDRKGRWAAWSPLAWAVIPLFYWGYTLIAAQLGITYINGARWPYYFINLDIYGWPIVLRNVAILTVAFLALGYLLWGLDRLLGSFDKKAVRNRVLYHTGEGVSVPLGGETLTGAQEDPAKERLIERALAAEPILADSIDLPGTGPESGVTALAGPPQRGDAVPAVSATTLHRDGAAMRRGTEVTTAHPGTENLQ